MQRIIKEQGEKADKLRVMDKKDDLLKVLDEMEQKRLQGDQNLDEENLKIQRINGFQQLMHREEEKNKNNVWFDEKNERWVVETEEDKQKKAEAMKRRKYMPRNGRFNVQQMQVADNPIVNLAGEEYKRQRQNQLVQDKMVEMYLDQFRSRKLKQISKDESNIKGIDAQLQEDK